MEATSKIATIPFFRILPLIVVGVVLQNEFNLPQWMLLASFIVAYVFAWITIKYHLAGWIYSSFTLMFAAMLVTDIRSISDTIPKDEKLLVELSIQDNIYTSGRWQRTTAQVGKYRLADDFRRQWRDAYQKIELWVDTAHKIETGQIMVCRTYLNPIAATPKNQLTRKQQRELQGYARLMKARGYTSRAYITPGNIVVTAPQRSQNLNIYAKNVQSFAAQRLQRLPMDKQLLAIASAMTVGEKRSMPKDLKQDYAVVGASHLLAVSGLHVGIVFLLINIIIYFVSALRRGHILKNMIAIAAIWGFALMAGMSPSVIRSAMMFSGAQIALATNNHRNTLNIVLATATVMLLFDPNNLYDISFQLSFIAVLSIVILFPMLYGIVQTRYRAINALWSVLIVGIVATAGTAPMVAYVFSNFPMAGIIINPVTLITAHIIVLISILWILFPIAVLGTIAGTIIGWAVGLQNKIVEWAASLPFAGVEVNISIELMWLWYAGYAVVIILLLLRENAKKSSNLVKIL